MIFRGAAASVAAGARLLAVEIPALTVVLGESCLSAREVDRQVHRSPGRSVTSAERVVSMQSQRRGRDIRRGMGSFA